MMASRLLEKPSARRGRRLSRAGSASQGRPTLRHPTGGPIPGTRGEPGARHSRSRGAGVVGAVPTHTNPTPWGQELASGLQAWEPSIKHWVSWEASVAVIQA